MLDLDPGHHSTPGKKTTAGEVLLAYLPDQVHTISQQDIQIRRGGDDAIHQLRVAARRIRSALRVFGKLMDPQRIQPFGRDLR